MRDYAKIAPTFWTGDTGKKLRKRGIEGPLVALYLCSAPLSNMLGLYYQPVLFMAHETGLSEEGARKGLIDCIETGFCHYDDESEVVFIPEMAKWQVAESLKATDNRCAGLQKDYEALPDCPFLGMFFDRYARAFHLTTRRERRSESHLVAEAPLKPLRSQEQEQEQEQAQEQEQEQEKNLTPGVARFPKPTATRSARAPAEKSGTPLGTATWNAYSTAYADRYGAAPVRNAKVSAQIAQLVSRLGIDEAPRVAAFFVSHNRQDYVRATHTVDLLLRDAEGLRTQWKQGRQTTHTQAAQTDRTQTNASAFEPLIAEARAREAQGAE